MATISSTTYEGNFIVKSGVDTLLNGEGTITTNGYLKFRGEGTTNTFITLNSTQTTNTLIGIPTINKASDTISLLTSSDILLNKTITDVSNLVYASGIITSSDNVFNLRNISPTTVNQVLTYTGSDLVWQSPTTAIAAGTSGQIQYNLGGVLTGAANFNIDTSDSYPIIQGIGSDLITAPTIITNGVKLYGLLRANKTTLSQIDKNLSPVEFQTSIGTTKIGWWSASGNTTTISTFSLDNNATGTPTARTVATTNNYTLTRRIGFVSAAAINSSAGTRSAILAYCIGTSFLNGGFYYIARFGIGNFAATMRLFVGLIGSDAVIGNVDPSTLTNIIGFGMDVADSNIQFMYGGSSVSKVNTVIVGAANLMWEIRIFIAGGSTTIGYSIEEFNSGTIISGSVSGTLGTTIPAATTLLTPQLWVNTAAGAGAVSIDVSTQYIETLY